MHSNWAVNVCEAAATLYGIELAVRFGYSHVHLEGDSMIIVSAIENKVEGLTLFISSMIVFLI